MSSSITVEPVIRLAVHQNKLIPLAAKAGFRKAVVEDPKLEAACREAGIATTPFSSFAKGAWADAGKSTAGRPFLLEEGMWPGISRGGQGGPRDETASASHQPWIDANAFWVRSLQAVQPARPAVLGFVAGEKSGFPKERIVPYESAELGLIDTLMAGGNWLLQVEPRFEADLLAAKPKALEAWKALGGTMAWLREHAACFRQPVMPIVTVLVEPGTESAELANLMCRQNVSPCLAPAGAPPTPNPARTRALVACGIHPPAPAERNAILAHAQNGATVVTDDGDEHAWWKGPAAKMVRDEEDRIQYALGKGLLYAYKTKILDPSEFAFDVIDFIHHRRRAVRLWNALTVIATAVPGPNGGAVLQLVNYGSPVEVEFPARIQGLFARATMLRPEAAPLGLKPAKRGETSEVQIPGIRTAALIEFS